MSKLAKNKTLKKKRVLGKREKKSLLESLLFCWINARPYKEEATDVKLCIIRLIAEKFGIGKEKKENVSNR